MANVLIIDGDAAVNGAAVVDVNMVSCRGWAISRSGRGRASNASIARSSPRNAWHRER